MADLGEKQEENKLKVMLRRYKDAIGWRNATGRGVEEAGGTIEAELNRRCARFAELDAIFGTRPNMNPPETLEFSAPGEEPEDALAVPENGLSPTSETSDHEATTRSGINRNRHRVSSSASSVQSKRRKLTSFDAGISNALAGRFATEDKRLEMQMTTLQSRLEAEREERRLQAEREERRFEVEQEERKRRLALDERKISLEEKTLEATIRRLETEKQLSEERTLMLRLKLEKLEKP
jgi:hypothetical protein